MRTARGIGGCAALLVMASGCLPRDRINRSCRWTGDTVALAPVGDPARRHHLMIDVQVIEDLAIRRGDSAVGRTLNSDEHRAAVAKCLGDLKRDVAVSHGASEGELKAVVGARDLWVDWVAVLLPMIPIFLFASYWLSKRIVASQAPDDITVVAITLALLTPAVAAVGLAATGQLAWAVEYFRSGNEHISFRAMYLPHARHGWWVWGVGMVLFAGVAVRVLSYRGGATNRRT